MVSWAASELSDPDENTNLTYVRETKNGLKSTRLTPYRRAPHRVHPIAHSTGRLQRLAFERQIHAYRPAQAYDPSSLHGTAIKGRTHALLPENTDKQDTACDETNPKACGETMICIIAEGETSGTCESQLTLKFQGTEINATVRKVGQEIAIVVDNNDDAAVKNEDIDTLIERFDTHIAPRIHQFFGDAKKDGRDRDGNGVVIAFFTSQVKIAAGASVVGFFLAQDMESTATNANSNGADMLYLQPPGSNTSINALSGTIGHEYQHLINYYAKVTRNESEQEERWLDEGLAVFAEDILGYGEDAYKNVLAYMLNASDTSLTGYGLIASDENEADSFERRGMAYLLIRHWFEAHGGAEFPSGAGEATDRGGIAAIRKLVQSEDTGIDVLTASGQDWPDILGELLVSIAVDGTPLECLSGVGFEEPQDDGYTNFQRGIDLRTPISLADSTTIDLNGPSQPALESKDVPIPINGGEFHTIDIGTSNSSVKIGGPTDLNIGMKVFANP